MGSDADWVSDVRRWYFDGEQARLRAPARPTGVIDDEALGYEAADPPLQAVNWPEARDELPSEAAAATGTEHPRHDVSTSNRAGMRCSATSADPDLADHAGS